MNRCIDSLPSAPPTCKSPRDTEATSTKTLRPLSSLKLPHSAPAAPSSNANAFSVLMSSHAESSAWAEAQVNEDRGFRPTKANGGRRKAPFYKVLQGMPIAVDGFRYGAIPSVTAYFLTCVKHKSEIDGIVECMILCTDTLILTTTPISPEAGNTGPFIVQVRRLVTAVRVAANSSSLHQRRPRIWSFTCFRSTSNGCIRYLWTRRR